MQTDNLIKTLGLDSSANLLRAGDRSLETAPAVGHVFRLAAAHRGLKAVYTLRSPNENSGESIVPVLYVCEASTDEDADLTHRLVWNQDIVPFVLINTPDSVRLYSGFRYRRRNNQTTEGLLQVLKSTKDILQLSETLGAQAIDEGRIWRTWGSRIHSENRVDFQLLENLRRLDQWLQANNLEQEISHALIGKYVYLRYLKDRNILSKRKLDSWGIAEEEVFGRDATLSGLQRTVERLDDWLNGGVFPLHFGTRTSLKQEHLERVAATFVGDQPLAGGSWQLHLDFQAYDFSYIPIETLSVVYEQFLHAPSETSTVTKGREKGAYYTPIPVVNFMLAEMDDCHPLNRGMRVFDPSCGSGAFLVQCYRRLIEREFPPYGKAPTPVQLRTLLQEHIFGVDRDADACSVTELSLIMTLLDYVDPPDLENDKRIKLPTLRNQNIFCEDFFKENADWHKLVAKEKFDWIVGNPPWKKLTSEHLNQDDLPAWQFMMNASSDGKPIGRYELAQAFMWGVNGCLAENGQAALLIPAMSLFEDHSLDFRSALFKYHQIQSVANFSNLAEVLFAGRSRVPAAAVFFKLRQTLGEIPDDEVVATYSPLVANQEPTRPTTANTRQETWSLVLNASEVRDISARTASSGAALPWKIAAWGSELDERLLRRMNKTFDSLGDLEKKKILLASQGLELRSAEANDKVDAVPEVVGKLKLDVNELEEMRSFFDFPESALTKVGAEKGYFRLRGGKLPLTVCRPPHIIVSAARNFAIFSDEYIVVPPRQVGIVSPTNDRDFLIALSLYLSSDFVFYHQFFHATQFGVQRGRATLNALRELPVPEDGIRGNLKKWVQLHSKLVEATNSRFTARPSTLFSDGLEAIADDYLIGQLNRMTSEALGLTSYEEDLVYDLVHVKLELNDGKVGLYAIEPPAKDELLRYSSRLKAELDGFIDGELSKSHKIEVLTDAVSGLVSIELADTKQRHRGTRVCKLGEPESRALSTIRERLRRERSQWVYFDRNLRIYEHERTLILKPLQRFHWTAGQAVVDANQIIAETLSL